MALFGYDVKEEAEKVIDEISNLSESFWNEYDSLKDYNFFIRSKLSYEWPE